MMIDQEKERDDEPREKDDDLREPDTCGSETGWEDTDELREPDTRASNDGPAILSGPEPYTNPWDKKKKRP